MVSEELTPQKLRQLLDYNPETGVFVRKVKTQKSKIGDVVGTNINGYLCTKIKNKIYYLHRLAWFFVYEKWPTKDIDHINRVKTDNKISNLREVTRQQNLQNRVNATGVFPSKNKKRWRARINFAKQAINLGSFATKEEAMSAYKEARKIYHPYFYND
jgi:hypothetical protein